MAEQDNYEDYFKLCNILLCYRFPKELITLKILIDIDGKIGCGLLSQEIIKYLYNNKVTHNLLVENKKDLNELIKINLGKYPAYRRIKNYLQFFSMSIS